MKPIVFGGGGGGGAPSGTREAEAAVSDFAGEMVVSAFPSSMVHGLCGPTASQGSSGSAWWWSSSSSRVLRLRRRADFAWMGDGT